MNRVEDGVDAVVGEKPGCGEVFRGSRGDGAGTSRGAARCVVMRVLVYVVCMRYAIVRSVVAVVAVVVGGGHELGETEFGFGRRRRRRRRGRRRRASNRCGWWFLWCL